MHTPSDLHHGPGIVVVEDEAIIRDHAVALLDELGFDVADFESADDALLHIEAHAGDVSAIFTDVGVPGNLDGMDLAALVSDRWPAIALIITSGTILPGDSRLPDTATFLPKPWLPLDLLVEVDRLGLPRRMA